MRSELIVVFGRSFPEAWNVVIFVLSSWFNLISGVSGLLFLNVVLYTHGTLQNTSKSVPNVCSWLQIQHCVAVQKYVINLLIKENIRGNG